MWKDDGYLLDMLLAARQVRSFLVGVDEGRFQSDQILHYAVMQRLTVIGEAASKVSPATRDAHSMIPWRSITGMRNILVHAYGKVKLDIVWDAATRGVGELIAYLESISLPEPDSPQPLSPEPTP